MYVYFGRISFYFISLKIVGSDSINMHIGKTNLNFFLTVSAKDRSTGMSELRGHVRNKISVFLLTPSLSGHAHLFLCDPLSA